MTRPPLLHRFVRHAAALSLLAAARAGAQPYDVVLAAHDLMIPTRDGARMATDVYRPAHGGVAVDERLPVLLNRTPYDKGTLADDARYFARHGYVVAVQDVRGRYRSEGKFSKVQPADATDGYDTIEWLARQPWSNGSVGTWGTSFAAHTQAGAAQLHPPALKTMVVNMGGLSNGWDHGVRYRGAYEMGRQITWAWSQLAADAPNAAVKKLLEREKVEDWYAVQPMRRGLNALSVAPEYEGWYLDFFEHADYDAFWKDPMVNWSEHYAETSDVPMLQVGGWYDIFLAGTFENFLGLSKAKKSPQRVLVGPWTHHGNTRPYAGDVSFGPAAAITDFDGDFHLRWFDHWLKGVPNGVEREAPVRLFVMGTGDGHKDADGRLFHGGYWRDATAWPIPGTRLVPYYFHADGSLSTARPREARAFTTYTYDPRHPVPTIGGGVSARLKDGGYDQREDPRFPPSTAPWRPLNSRADVVVFQTEPLAEDVTVIGPITVTLYASTNATDTDFTAKLVDVYPPSDDWPGGFDLNLTDAIMRGRYRATRDHAVLLVPGTVYPFTIAPFPTANVFKKGHRIRIDVSSSNFPRFDANPNTGEPLGRSRRVQSADNTIWHDAARPSHVVLPLAPARP
ncbi:hydrolase CocE/NonD family protein [Gemmatirosa kalamazoonensis]|uniref:Hydrolase CocE/NonD family protein n=1 Tax=Gemmatirosa kalamazoonensis TaxID=861299 RepID=W0REU8_9BACT|nr:CocE/NonD family hydrolase [Gemmatirosa kalamazoonensis]AHG89306.1 hydrolase CocE/NonD family protein [Gemmatirosa kalamazoonensis]